ncbi:ABC transporter permease [Agromyces neolithicus]|uniref:ABC transporter permease n=1 Tax=Agromyces neolithicus TaxID=269420 RepID=A0ABP4YK98_9MICO
MSTTITGARAGFGRGLIELRLAFSGAELVGQVFWPVATLVAIFLVRDVSIGAGYTLDTFILPGTLGMFVALGMLLVVQQLAADREDGSLLRAKITPQGIPAYLIGKLVQISATIVAYLAIVLLPGLVFVDGLDLGRPGSWLTFAWVVVLGLIATQTIGAALGSLVSSSRGAGYLSLPILGLIAISGIFAPITALPEWLAWIAQVFPVYWLGLGMRSALLPDAAAAVEIGGSWRPVETAMVLGAWVVAGIVLAPIVLRRMARKESGSRVAERRERALQRVG